MYIYYIIIIIHEYNMMKYYFLPFQIIQRRTHISTHWGAAGTLATGDFLLPETE